MERAVVLALPTSLSRNEGEMQHCYEVTYEVMLKSFTRCSRVRLMGSASKNTESVELIVTVQ